MKAIAHAVGVLAKTRDVLARIGKGFSLIVAPHGTGATVTFNLPGHVATLLLVLLIVLVAGLAFVGVTYTRLALLAVETRRLRAENEVLREESGKIEEIKQEIAQIDHLRQQIELWAGVLPETLKTDEPATYVIVPSQKWGRRRYTYAIMKPFYTELYGHPQAMILPAAGWVSRRFIGDDGNQVGHPGVDIVAPRGTSVRCVLDGTVRFEGWDEVYGNLLVVDHNDTLSTVYGHNDRLLVKEGDHVAKGQVIATVGSTGRSTAPHLHFEILVRKLPVDPEIYLNLAGT